VRDHHHRSGLRSALYLPIFDALADPAVVARLAAEAEEAGFSQRCQRHKRHDPPALACPTGTGGPGIGAPTLSAPTTATRPACPLRALQPGIPAICRFVRSGHVSRAPDGRV